MKVVVTAEGNDLNASTNPRFGRCPSFIFVDTDSLAYEVMANPATSASGGAGVRAAQFVVEQDAQAVLTGNIGPNAVEVLQAAGIPVYLHSEATVRVAVEALMAGQLAVAKGANVEAHAGMHMQQSVVASIPAASVEAREKEIAALSSMAADLRQKLAEITDRIEKLEKET
jgi:predicted Fe-Mo cluster-binding NifX family protein